MNNNSNGAILAVILIVVIAIGAFLLYRDSRTEAPNNNGGSLEINLGETKPSNS